MHNLRNAIGKDEEAQQTSLSRFGPSRLQNKNKNMTILALDDEEDDDFDKAKQNIETLLINAYKKDPAFSEMVLYEVVQQVQSESQGMAEMDCLTNLEIAIHSLSNSKEIIASFKNWLSNILQLIIRKIKKTRRKQKKSELQQFQKIVQTNFKRKGAAFIDEDIPDRNKHLKFKEEQLFHQPKNKNLQGSSKRSGSGSSSTDGKLGQLLCSSKLKDQKKKTLVQDNAHEESVSFSAVISQNMTVRQRGRREGPNKYEKKQKDSNKTIQEPQGDNDQAFMFFRPKAGKKK